MTHTTDSAPGERASRDRAIGAKRRLRVTRARRVILGQLAPAEREDLSARAYAIYAAYKRDVDRATFQRAFLSDDATRVALFHGEDGAFAGFATAAIDRVDSAAQRLAVYSALLFIDTHYSGVGPASLFAIKEALRFKLREPRTPLAYMGVVTSPASYRMFAATMPTFYPARGAAVPPGAARAMRDAARARGLTFVDEERLLVRGLGAPRYPERLRGAATLRDDPDARFYLDRNPAFDEGVGMLIWVPLTLGNLLGALARRVQHAAR